MIASPPANHHRRHAGAVVAPRFPERISGVV